MELERFIGLKVKIQTNNKNNKYYYVGVVLDADKNSLDLKDFKGQLVSISKNTIFTIQEVRGNVY